MWPRSGHTAVELVVRVTPICHPFHALSVRFVTLSGPGCHPFRVPVVAGCHPFGLLKQDEIVGATTAPALGALDPDHPGVFQPLDRALGGAFGHAGADAERGVARVTAPVFDVVVVRNPDGDHSIGLPDVLALHDLRNQVVAIFECPNVCGLLAAAVGAMCHALAVLFLTPVPLAARTGVFAFQAVGESNFIRPPPRAAGGFRSPTQSNRRWLYERRVRDTEPEESVRSAGAPLPACCCAQRPGP